MRKCGKRRFVTFMVAVMIASFMMFSFATTKSKAADQVVYRAVPYGNYPGMDCGYILEPTTSGTYPVVILQHGDHTQSIVKENMCTAMKKWVNAGLLDPMIIVTPYVLVDEPVKNTYKEFAQNQIPEIIKRLDDGTFESLLRCKIDHSKKYGLAGWAYGGCVAAYAGMKYKDSFPYLAIISPSKDALDPGRAGANWIANDPETKDYPLNTDSDRVFMMFAGAKEPDYETMLNIYYQEFGEENDFTKVIWKNGEHRWADYEKGLFYFLYRLQKGTDPTDEVLGQLYDDIDKTVTGDGNEEEKPAITGSLSFTTPPKYGFNLITKIENCNAADSIPRNEDGSYANDRSPYAYRWYRDDQLIPDERKDRHLLTVEDVGHIITCEVRSSIGAYSGCLTASIEILKADGPMPPSGITTTAANKGAKNGCMNNVTTAMEFCVAGTSYWIDCTDSVVYGLAAGSYEIRYKETATHKHGGIATVKILELDTPMVGDPLTGNVTINGQAEFGYQLTAEVDASNASEFSYQWYRGGGAIRGAISQDYTLGASDIGKMISCEVTDKSGTFTGSIKGIALTEVQKADGPDAPTGLVPVSCTKGMADGRIQNVTSSMEYSIEDDTFEKPIDCTGEEIIGLRNGNYYIRYKETETHKCSDATAVRIEEKDESQNPDSNDVSEIFADVTAGKWYVNAIQFVYDRRIMNGKGEDPNGSGKMIFDPNANLTRAEFATILYSMENKPGVDYSHEILDVKDLSAWYAKPVHWVYEQNIAAGYPNGYFGIADAITREQLAQMLYKYAKLKEYTTEYREDSLERFGDTGKISNWAIEAMKWATSNGVMNGSAHEIPLLNPKGNATRAECAAMIKSLIEKGENDNE